MTDVFISYSRRDKEFVARLFSALAKRSRDAWVDWEGIPPTADWRQEIYAAIDASNALIFVLSPDSAASEVCGLELKYAEAQNKRLVPLVFRDTNTDRVPGSLAALNWIFIRSSDDFEEAIETLVEALDTDLDRIRAHTRLLMRAREWETRQHHSLLLRSRDLTEAETQFMASAGLEPRPTPLQLQFLRASRTRATRRQGIFMSMVTVALAVTAVLATVAWVQRQYSERRASAATIRNLAPIKPSLAMALAVGEMDRWFADAVPEVRSTLLAALQTPKEQTKYLPGTTGPSVAPPLTAVVVTSSGAVATARDASLSPPNEASSLLVWTEDTTKPARFSVGAPILAVAGCREAPVAAVFTERGTLNVVDLDAQRVESTVSLSEGRVVRGADGAESRGSAYGGPGGPAAYGPPGGGVLSAYGARASSYGRPSAYGSRTEAPAGNRRSSGTTEGCTPVGLPAALVAMSANCAVIAIATEGSLELWSRQGPDLKRLRKIADRRPLSLAVSPTGQYVLEGYGDGRIRRTYATPTSRNTDGLFAATASWCPVTALAMSPDGRRAASADGSVVRVWQAFRSGAREVGDGFHGHRDLVTSLAFDPVDGDFIVSGGRDNSVREWSLKGPSPVDPFRGHNSWVRSVAVAPNGASIFTASNDGSVRRWPTGTLLSPLPCAPDLQGTALVDANDTGTALLVVGGTGLAIVSARQGDTCDREQLAAAGSSVAALSTDGRFVAFLTGPKRVVIIDQEDATDRLEVELPVGGARALAIHASGDVLAATGNDGRVRIWRRSSGRWTTSTGRHDRPIDALALSPDGQLLASGGEDNTVMLWRIDDLSRVGSPLRGHEGWVSTIAFSPDGRRVAAGSWDRTVRLWNLDGTPMGRALHGHTDKIVHVAFDDDQPLIVSYGADFRIGRWIGGGDSNEWMNAACQRLAEQAGAIDSGDRDAFSRAKSVCTRRLSHEGR